MSAGSDARRLVGRRTWDLQRFGLTPAKLVRRVSNAGTPAVFAVSIPKAGTHLLERALCLHPKLYRRLMPTVHDANVSRWGSLAAILHRLRPGEVVVSHLSFRDGYPAALAAHRVPAVFITRHPRDVITSLVHYVADRGDHRLHAAFAGQPDDRARTRLAIEGSAGLGVPSIGERFRAFEGWLDAPGCLRVRYEDLVGPKGGADAGRQHQAIDAVFAHLGMPLDPDRTATLAARLFSANSPTFRHGVVGDASRRFDDDLEDLFERTIGDQLARYDYPS
jgi:hypothetical protein